LLERELVKTLRTRLLVVFSLLCFAACASVLTAEPSGGVVGQVKDKKGAAIVGAKITLTRINTGATATTVSGKTGEYQFVQLAPAVYRLVATAPGFTTMTVASVEVLVDRNTQANLDLPVGSVTESVVVDSAVPMVETQQNTLSGVMEGKSISSLPLNARNFADLALLTPGATPSASGNQVSGFNVAGARTQSNSYLIDGVSNMDTQNNAGLSSFRVNDAIQEFSVQTSVPTAEFGRGQGAQVNAVTRSGSNELHGTAFEYFRNTVLDATDYFTKHTVSSTARKATVNRNQFGGTLGGPIRRDKTFFFGSYEGFRQVAPTVTLSLVPTDAQRATVTDPISKALLAYWPKGGTVQSGTNYTSNVPSSLMDNTGLLRIDHELSEKDRLSGHYIVYRGAQTVGGTTPLSGGYTNAPASTSTEVEENHIFTPTFVNVVRFGYSMNSSYNRVQDYGFNAASIFTDSNGSPLAGVVDATSNPQDSGLPNVSIVGGYATLGSSASYPQGRTSRTYELYDTATYMGRANHTVKWGAHLRREDLRRYLDSASRGTIGFASFADFAVGQATSSQLRTGSTMSHYRRYPLDFFLQDQWHPLPNLTINYGIRYELPSAIFELNDHGSNLVDGQGMTLFGSSTVLDIDTSKTGKASLTETTGTKYVTNSGVRPDRDNVSPVIGFSYSPDFAGQGKTVLRGGFRIGYDETFNNIPANQSLNAPFNLTTTQTAGTTQTGKFSYATAFSQNVSLVSNVGKQGPGTPTVGLLTLYAMQPNMPSSYNYAYNFSIEREITRSLSVEADYIGSSSHKLGVYLDANEPTVTVNDATKRGSVTPNEQTFPYPHFSSIYRGSAAGSSNYNGAVFTAKYRGRSAMLQSSYTLGHSLDDTSSYFGSTSDSLPADPRHLKTEYGNSGFDLRQRWSTYYGFALPIGAGHRILGSNNAISKRIFNDWQVSGMTVVQSGLPFTVHLSSSVDYSGFHQFTDRPNVIGSGKLKVRTNNPDSTFDTTYFSTSIGAGQVGTERRNQHYGPGLFDFDTSITKSLPIAGKYRFLFRTDIFNLFNHTNFANPNATTSSSSFGKIKSTVAGASSTSGGAIGGARLVQFSGRISF
jgi:hypothetical protein